MKSILGIISGAVIIFLILLLLDRTIEKKFDEDNVCYVTTKSFRLYTGADGQRMVLFNFIVEDKEYESSYQINREMEGKIKDILRVQYVCNDPKANRLVFE